MSDNLWARIANGAVAEIVALDSSLTPGVNIFTPALTFVNITGISGVAEGWLYNGSTFTAPPAATVTQAQLAAYATQKAASLFANARSYTAGGITIAIDATQGTRTDLGDLVEWGTANAAAVQPWIDNSGNVTEVTGAQFVALAPLVGAYALSGYSELAAVLGEIKAGTMTTTAAIDAAGWTV